MKIRLFSDLHLEFSNSSYAHLWTPSLEDKETTLVLAGDIHVGQFATEFIDDLCNHFKYVIYICGNHEFYNNEISKVIDYWRRFDQDGPKNFHYLNKDTRFLDGVRFVGGTMWTGFNKKDPAVMDYAAWYLNDYKTITEGGKQITSSLIYEEHKSFIRYLTDILDTPYEGNTVVVTHHSPGNGYRLKEYSDHLIPYYYADLEEFISLYSIYAKVKYWFHGHIHESYDYMIEGTRIVSNPYGYYREATNGGFRHDLILEI